MILAVDPGLRFTGWAYSREGKLAGCGLAQGGSGSLWDRSRRIVDAIDFWTSPRSKELTVIGEKPKVYRQRLAKGDPNDLIDLAFLLGAIVQGLAPVKADLALPRDWKGTIPKKRDLHKYLVHQRILKRMDPTETLIYRKAIQAHRMSESHNICDAVGILFWYLRRSDPPFDPENKA
jgi:hypothetical protein